MGLQELSYASFGRHNGQVYVFGDNSYIRNDKHEKAIK